MKYLIMILVGVAGFASIAQQVPPILTATKLKPGIYLHYNEFLLNEPSISGDFELRPRSAGTEVKEYGAVHKLIRRDSSITRADVNLSWGVCSNDSVYVNVGNFLTDIGFLRIEHLGRFSYFRGMTSESKRGEGGHLLLLPLEYIPRKTMFVLDINTSWIAEANKEVMFFHIFKNDPELLKRFKAEPDKKNADVLTKYLEQYNARHVQEIEFNIQPNVFIYRKKGQPEFVATVTTDTLVYTIHEEEIISFYLTPGKREICADGNCKTITIKGRMKAYLQCKPGMGSSHLILRDPMVGMSEIESVTKRFRKSQASKTNETFQ
jgi:hypothetical protein